MAVRDRARATRGEVRRGRLRRGLRAWAGILTTTAVFGMSVPVAAAPTPIALRVKRPKVTPADAAQRRAAAQVRANALADSGESIAAGIEFDNAAAELGDPVLYLDAGEAYLTGAEKSRNTELADATIERARISLDILYFHLDSSADKNFRLVDSTEVPALIVRAQDLIEDAESLIEEIEAEEAAALEQPQQAAAPKKKRGRAAKITGGVLIGAGAVMTAIGSAGIALGVRHQQSAEHSTVYGEEYDDVAERGERANRMAWVGIPSGLVLIGAGVTVLVLTSDKYKKNKRKKNRDKYSVVPTFDRHGSGVAVSGRF